MLEALAATASMSGTLCSQENFSIMDAVGQNTFSRLFAAPVTRFLLDLGGRQYYSIFQMILSFLACTIVWFVLRTTREPSAAARDSIADLVGNTPMLQSKVFARLGFKQCLHVKLESFNPTGSLKDRSASNMVWQAEMRGLIIPYSGQTLVESTSGNFAKALAMQCTKRGYKCLLVVDQNGLLKSQLAEPYGAKIDLVDAPPGTSMEEQRRLRIVRVAEIVKSDPTMINLNQYDNLDNEAAYLGSLAPEICAQQPNLDAVVLTASTGGHLRGCARHLREHMPHVKVIAVEPPGSKIFNVNGGPATRLIQPGDGLHYQPVAARRCLEEGLVDEIYIIDDMDAIMATMAFCRFDGLMAGPSTGRAAFAALCHLQHGGASQRIVILCCDRLDPYKEKYDKAIEQHFGEIPSDERLTEELCSRVQTVARTCVKGEGMLDPALVLEQSREQESRDCTS